MRDMAPNKAMKLTSALAERADLLGVVCWRSARGRQEAPRRSQLIAGVGRTEGKEEGHRWEGTLQRSSGHA